MKLIKTAKERENFIKKILNGRIFVKKKKERLQGSVSRLFNETSIKLDH